jgi:LysM repeat protein
VATSNSSGAAKSPPEATMNPTPTTAAPAKDKEEATDLPAVQDSDMAAFLARTSVLSLGVSSRSSSGKLKEAAAPGVAKPGDATVQTHKIGKTDTLAGIAMRYGSSVEELKKLNKLWSERDMFSRSTLQVPVRDEAVLARARAEKVAAFLSLVPLGCDEERAIKVLGKHGWALDKAVAAHKEAVESEMAKRELQQRALLNSSDSSAEELGDPSAFYGKVGEHGVISKGAPVSEEDLFNEL